MPRFARVDVDVVARALADPGSRRRLLRALGAGLLTSFAASGHDNPDAAARQRSRRRRKKPARCQKPGAVCNQRKLCCKGTKCAGGRCQCPASKKRCGARCVSKPSCCPANGDVCGDSSSTSCSAGFKPCGKLCILESGCCHHNECTHECETGTCLRKTHICDIKRWKSCGSDGSGRCNSAGVCAQTCEKDEDCPSLPGEYYSAEEFCRKPTCEGGVCEIGTKSREVIVPDEFQSKIPCEVLICEPGIQNRYGVSRDRDIMNDAVPEHPNDCLYWTCRFESVLNEEPDRHPAGWPCGVNGTGQCDGHGRCVDGS